MGVIIAKVFQKEKEPKASDFIAPTSVQMQIVKDTWEIPKRNLTDTGEYILFRFLDDYPKNQDQFDAFKSVPLLSLKVSFKNFCEIFKSLPKNLNCFPGYPGISNPCRPHHGSVPKRH